ncbi:MAG: cytochrome oxidase assembly protein [Cellulomonadaceae bacterium]|nr:cytochrome oxidase assembly protein [Cellulomonadaceae bacterium]
MSSTASPAAPETRLGAPRRWAPSPTWVRRILLANLVGQVVIVVTGGAVRLTGSGLGCSTWPQCEPGQFTPVLHEAASWHPFIEFGNRTLSGVLVMLGIATAWAVLSQHRSPGLRLLSLAPLIGVLAQAVLGGLTVLVDLNPALVGSHLLISMLLIAASTALVLREREPDRPTRPLVDRRTTLLTAALVPLTAVVLALGVVVTGSGPHSGDEDAAYRFALDPVMVARLHSASVWAYLAVVVAVLVLARRAVAPPAIRAATILLGVALAQGLIGYVQYLTGLPVVLVGAHMLGASLLVVAQTAQVFSVRTRQG